MTERDAARILADVADGVGHAHVQRIVHQDIKPGNILLEFSSTNPRKVDDVAVRITDFRLAWWEDTESGTDRGRIGGTPR